MVGHVVTFRMRRAIHVIAGHVRVRQGIPEHLFERHPICDDDKSDRISPIQLFQPKRNVQRNKARYARKKRHKCLERRVHMEPDARPSIYGNHYQCCWIQHYGSITGVHAGHKSHVGSTWRTNNTGDIGLNTS